MNADETATPPPFLAGGGDLAALIAARDWSDSLGPIATWPQSLKTSVGLILHSPVPIVLLWGADGIMLYNDAYSGFAGDRHPSLLGSKVREGWPEVADFNDNVMKVGLAGGTLTYRNQELSLNRSGKLSPAWMDLFYSPVLDESGKPAGVIAVVVEITERVLAERTNIAQRERLAQMFQDAPSFMCQLDGPDHVFAFSNAAYQQLIAHRDVIGKPIREALPDIAGQGFYELLDRVYVSGESYRGAGVPVTLQRTPGAAPEERLLDFVYQPMRDSAGRVTGIFAEGHDVTESRRAEIRRAALVELGDRIRDIDAPDDLAYAAAKILGQALAVSRAGYGTIDPKAETITIARDWNAPGVASLAGVLRFRDYGSYIEDLKRGDTVVIADARNDPRARDTADALAGISALSFVNMPVSEQGGLVALLYLNNALPRAWSPEDIAFIREVAERTRTAVERRRAERRNADEQERQRRLFTQMPGFVGVLSGPDHTYEYVNAAYRKIAGDRDLLGKTVRQAFPELKDQGFFELLDQVYATGNAYTGRGVPARLADNAGDRFIDLVYEPIRDDDGAVTGIFVAGYDVTDAYRTMGALQESQAQLKAAVDALSELNADLERKVIERTAALQNIGIFYNYSSECHAMLALRDDGRFEYEEINPATLKLYGKTRDEVIGRTVEEVFGTEIAAPLTGQLHEALRRNTSYRYIRQQNGAAIEAVATPVPPEPGRRPRLTVTARDITERQNLEEQLRQAQKMEAVGQLTGGIAHDFNNLLQGITGALDRVQHRIAEGRTGDVDRFLKAAVESANRAAALTHRLLAFSRRQTLDPRPTDVNRLIGGMEDLIRRTMGPDIAVEVVGAAGLWPVRVDSSQLENSLLNLAINARDAMPQGGKLTIETANKWLDDRAAKERELPPGQYVSLCVTDTGTGMTPEVISRAFDPFFTTKPLGQGTGLGLSMIYGFVRQSGGQVRIYSEADKGSTMCLYFPRHFGQADAAGETLSELVERGFGETVLVVDDEPTVRMLIAEVLSENFYNIIEAGDGPAALKILQSDRRIDLMITDVGLPGGMNGRQVADAARIARKDLKVLFVTGYAENAAVANGHLDPGMEILAKPFAMSTLANKVREMIEL